MPHPLMFAKHFWGGANMRFHHVNCTHSVCLFVKLMRPRSEISTIYITMVEYDHGVCVARMCMLDILWSATWRGSYSQTLVVESQILCSQSLCTGLIIPDG